MSDGILLLLAPMLLGGALFLVCWAAALLLVDLVEWFTG